jgi:hypothetical protein
VLQTGAIYILAGTGIADITKASSADQKQIGLNIVAFAPEVGCYYDAQLAVPRAETDTLVAEIAANPDLFTSSQAMHGLATTRGGLTQTLIGIVTTFPLTGVDPAWIRDREVALMAFAPSAVKFLEADSRKQIAAAALRVAEGIEDPGAKEGLTAFAKAIGP